MLWYVLENSSSIFSPFLVLPLLFLLFFVFSVEKASLFPFLFYKRLASGPESGGAFCTLKC
jgi:hypothetical protein